MLIQTSLLANGAPTVERVKGVKVDMSVGYSQQRVDQTDEPVKEIMEREFREELSFSPLTGTNGRALR